MTALMTRHALRRIPIRAMLAAAVLLPSLSLIPAYAAPPPVNVDRSSTPQAIKATTERIFAEDFARHQAGLPPATGGGRNDCASVKADRKRRGIQGCTRPSTPAEINRPAIDAMLAEIDAEQAAQPAQPAPEPAPGEPVTANGLAPATGANNPPRSTACPYDGLRYDGRMDACQIYNFTHTVLDRQVNGDVVIGEAYFTVVEWTLLSNTRRGWDHHIVVRINGGWGAAQNGMNVYTIVKCTVAGCNVDLDIPANGWVFMPLFQNWHGVSQLSSIKNPTDYSSQNAFIWSYSPAGGRAARSETQFFDEVRCDAVAYIVSAGCAYWRQPGYFKLAVSDSTVDSSARFIRDAQIKLPTHPGVLGWVGLNRAAPLTIDANRKAVEPACKALKGNIQGYDCDEYPFASTNQGAASGTQGVNWQIALVDPSDNQKAGALLSGFYARNRMWYGDHFYVQISP